MDVLQQTRRSSSSSVKITLPSRRSSEEKVLSPRSPRLKKSISPRPCEKCGTPGILSNKRVPKGSAQLEVYKCAECFKLSENNSKKISEDDE